MIVSDSHKFIFVHIRKAAGTSIRDRLKPISNKIPKDIISKVKSRIIKTEFDYRKFSFTKHDSLRTVQKTMPKDRFEAYFKFAIVRNPWNRLASGYEYIKRSPDHHRYKKVIKMTFKEFIIYQSKRPDAHQVNMLCDKSGNISMDFIGRFENLQEDWNFICNKIGLEIKDLGHINNAGLKSYNSLYNDENRALIAKLWKKDIETFGYSWEQ